MLLAAEDLEPLEETVAILRRPRGDANIIEVTALIIARDVVTLRGLDPVHTASITRIRGKPPRRRPPARGDPAFPKPMLPVVPEASCRRPYVHRARSVNRLRERVFHSCG